MVEVATKIVDENYVGHISETIQSNSKLGVFHPIQQVKVTSRQFLNEFHRAQTHGYRGES